MLIPETRHDNVFIQPSRLKWTFKQEEVAKLREELTACKITLNLNVNLAASVAKLYNLGTANATVNRIEADVDTHVWELEEKLPGILEQLEE
ncbi:hypothetical protein OEA41_009697 [Lepraria neglecta]|uniref:YTH domain-containing protein n=1 Tax=Lepraria neglecta TaxID=209136 RepID=A0AAD9Z2R5_9LECA|nr:hypothetical protein OEA41_009697 [Lepraria neglecta]